MQQQALGVTLLKHGPGFPGGSVPSIGAQMRIGLIAHYEFEGFNLFNDIHGTYDLVPISGGTFAGTTGRVRDCILWGTSYLRENGSLLAIQNSFSVAGWIRFVSLPAFSTKTVVSKGTPAGALEYTIITLNVGIQTDLIGIVRIDGENLSVGAAPVGGLLANTWYFFAFTYNFDGITHRLQLTINDQASFSEQLYTGVRGTSSDFVTFGCKSDLSDPVSSSDRFDEFSFWARCISLNEVLYLYNGGNGRAFPWQSGALLQEGNDNNFLTPDGDKLAFP